MIRRAAALSLLLSLLVAGTYLAWHDHPVAARIEGASLDLRFLLRGPLEPAEEILLVLIDDDTVADAGAWPLPRTYLARGLERLREAGVAAIGIDLLLLEQGEPAADQSLRQVLTAGEETVLAIVPRFQEGGSPSPTESEDLQASAYTTVYRPAEGPSPLRDARPQGFLLPLESLRKSVRLGHVTLDLAPDGAPRFMRLAVPYGEGYLPALPLELLRISMGLAPGAVTVVPGQGFRLGDRFVETDGSLALAINFPGPPGKFPQLAFHELLSDMPLEHLRERLVLVGTEVTGASDSFPTPYAQAVPGVEVLASVTDNLLRDRALSRAAEAKALDLGAIMMVGLASGMIGFLLPAWVAGLAMTVLLIGLAGTLQAAFLGPHIWLNAVFPVAVALLNVGSLGLIRRFGPSRRSAEREGPQLAAVLFVDMADSTGFAERATSAATIDRLGKFHRMIERAMRGQGGRVQKYMGDGALALFTPNQERGGAAEAALRAALMLSKAIAQWSRSLAQHGESPIAIRIGLHYGPVTFARLGGGELEELTPTGDTVNLASRLESLAKEVGAQIVVSETLAAEVVGRGQRHLLRGFQELPPRPIRGRNGFLAVWVRR